MSLNVWTIQARADDTEPWRDVLVTFRSADFYHAWEDTPEPRRALLNGRSFRMRSANNQLDLFNEEEA